MSTLIFHVARHDKMPPDHVRSLMHTALRQVLWHAGCYAVCATVFAASQAVNMVPLSALAMVAMAFVMSFNFMALHETVHRSAFKSRLWNDIFMQVAGFLTLRPVIFSVQGEGIAGL